MNNLECPYCKGKAILNKSSAFIYNGTDYGPVHACENYPQCDAYVSCHPGTFEPTGRLADRTLRCWKKQAHKYFDPIWRTKKINKIYPVFIQGTSNRKKAYIWLSKQLGFSLDETHIGMFDIQECKRVIEICKPHYDE